MAGTITGTLSISHSASTAAAAHERLVQIDIASASAFRRGLVAFAEDGDELAVEALHEPVPVSAGPQTIELSLEAEGGKVDVLRADHGLIGRLAVGLGLDDGRVAAMLSELAVARKDEDAERALAVVRQYLVVAADDLDALVTVRGSDRIDPTLAADEVLAAIPDLNPVQLAQILAVSRQARGQFIGWSRYFGTGGRSFAIVARVDWAEDQRSVRRLPIELSTSGQAMVVGGAY